jgi:NAD(P)-dependent dehydrogenase (short-subunit alcohol dehydrogenase family)
MRLQGKVALISGSTRGIGRAIAEMFAAEGASVVVTGRSDAGEDVVRGIRAKGGEAVFLPANLTDEDQVRHLVAGAVTRYGTLTTLVNNAAPTQEAIPGQGDGNIADLATEHWAYMILAGLTGAVFWPTKYALPYLRMRGGSIINISSIAAFQGNPGIAAYTATKSAIQGLSRQIAVAYGKDGVRCNTVVSGLILSGVRPPRPAFEATMARVQLARRFGRPSDIGYACVYLASDESEFVTGQSFTIDGGITARTVMPSMEEAAEEARLFAGTKAPQVTE